MKKPKSTKGERLYLFTCGIVHLAVGVVLVISLGYMSPTWLGDFAFSNMAEKLKQW
jgi:hypothetical protein